MGGMGFIPELLLIMIMMMMGGTNDKNAITGSNGKNLSRFWVRSLLLLSTLGPSRPGKKLPLSGAATLMLMAAAGACTLVATK